MNRPTHKLKFNWLINEEIPASEFKLFEKDEGWIEYPFPEWLGKGGFERLKLSMGMTLFHARHNLLVHQKERYYKLANIEIDLPQCSLQCQTLYEGRILYQEQGQSFENKVGVDIFRYGGNFKQTPLLDISEPSEFMTLTITEKSIISMVGVPLFEKLMQRLELNTIPSICSRAIPLFISQLLKDSLNPTLSGKLRNLFAQSKALEYLTNFIDYLTQDQFECKPTYSLIKETELTKIYKKLVNLEGKLPTMDELVKEFGYSAQDLNNSFKKIYQETIYSVVNNARMDEAHKAISQTSTPLKVIAINLGYSHVNHFNNAFKRKYGYAPGSLRKKRTV